MSVTIDDFEPFPRRGQWLAFLGIEYDGHIDTVGECVQCFGLVRLAQAESDVIVAPCAQPGLGQF